MSDHPFEGLPWFDGGTAGDESVEVIVESGFVLGPGKYAVPGERIRLPRARAIEFRNKGMVRFASQNTGAPQPAALPHPDNVHPDAEDPESIRHRDPAVASPAPGRRSGARGRKAARPEE